MGYLPAVENALSPLQYPPIRCDDSIVDNYDGVLIHDPYRWLEDLDLEKTKDFVKNQAELTEFVLASCEERERLREEITTLFDHPRNDTPFWKGDKSFYFHNTGLQAQSIFYV